MKAIAISYRKVFHCLRRLHREVKLQNSTHKADLPKQGRISLATFTTAPVSRLGHTPHLNSRRRHDG